MVAADAIEAAACREMYAAAPAPLAARLGLEVRRVAGATLLMAPGAPEAFLNRVIGLGLERPASEDDLDAVLAAYRGARNWWVHVGPGAEPPELVAWLAARGFAPARRRAWAKVLRGTLAPPEIATPLEVRAARAGEEDPLGERIAAAFGMPAAFAPWFAALAQRDRWRAAVALEGGRVVGGGLLYLDGGDAWLGMGAVAQESRGQHAHRALMALRIREAIAAGAARIFTETGEPVGDEPNPSLANMHWCGFRRVCSRLNYAAPSL